MPGGIVAIRSALVLRDVPVEDLAVEGYLLRLVIRVDLKIHDGSRPFERHGFAPSYESPISRSTVGMSGETGRSSCANSSIALSGHRGHRR